MLVAVGTGVLVAVGTGVFVAVGTGVLVAVGTGVFVAVGTGGIIQEGGVLSFSPSTLVPLIETFAPLPKISAKFKFPFP